MATSTTSVKSFLGIMDQDAMVIDKASSDIAHSKVEGSITLLSVDKELELTELQLKLLAMTTL